MSALRPYVERIVRRCLGPRVEEAADMLARETPILLSYNGTGYAVMLATPENLEDFARGFSFTEGLVKSVAEIESITIHEHPEGLDVQLKGPALQIPAGQERVLAGRTGCGLCGVRSLAAATRVPPVVGGPRSPVSAVALHRAVENLPTGQKLNQKTGTVHAAAWAGLDGDIHAVREDVGRHNALDKLIGALLLAGQNPAEGFMLVTSRASYEMVAKAALFGAGVLVAVSGPTDLAVRTAQAAGLSLVGFARPQQHVIYTHPARLRD